MSSTRQASALTASRQRAPRGVCKRLLGGSDRRVVSPMVRSSRTVQPVLQSVMCAYLPQFVAHTPCRPQTNRFGLATDCTCNTPTKGKRLTRPDRTDVVTRTIVVTKGIIHVEAARRKSHHSKILSGLQTSLLWSISLLRSLITIDAVSETNALPNVM